MGFRKVLSWDVSRRWTDGDEEHDKGRFFFFRFFFLHMHAWPFYRRGRVRVRGKRS